MRKKAMEEETKWVDWMMDEQADEYSRYVDEKAKGLQGEDLGRALTELEGYGTLDWEKFVEDLQNGMSPSTRSCVMKTSKYEPASLWSQAETEGGLVCAFVRVFGEPHLLNVSSFLA